MKYVVLLLLIFSLHVAADEECKDMHSWSKYSKFEVTYSKNDRDTTFTYYQKDRESYMEIKTKSGVKKIFSSRYGTLWSGVDTGIKSHQECHSYLKDTFAIMQSYATRPLFFLSFASKKLPKDIITLENINLHSDKNSKVYIDGGNYMVIAGPWSLTGYIKKEKNTIVFDLAHTTKGNAYSLKGKWTDANVSIPIDDSSKLKEWLVCVPEKRVSTLSNEETVSNIRKIK